MKVAIFDIGTNSVIILALEITNENIRVQFEQALEPRLGENLQKSKKLSSRAIERTIRAAVRLIKTTGWPKVENLIAFGTHVLRVAENSDIFIEKFQKRTGFKVIVLSPEEEALYSCIGSMIDLHVEGDYAIVDVGGGSTEISYSSGGEYQFFSIPVGAVTLTEQFALEQPVNTAAQHKLQDYINSKLDEVLHGRKIDTVIGSGGTASSLAMVHLHLGEFEPSKIHGTVIDAAEVTKISDNLFSKTLPDLQSILFFSPGRADIIAAGTAIYKNVIQRLEAERFVISQKGIRWGIAKNYKKFISTD